MFLKTKTTNVLLRMIVFDAIFSLLKSCNVRYISLGDGRSLCLECMESAIMDTGDCQPLYHAIRDFYEGMQMKLDQEIPMLLVERQALNEAIVGEKNVNNYSLAPFFKHLICEITLIQSFLFLGSPPHARDKGFMPLRGANC